MKCFLVPFLLSALTLAAPGAAAADGKALYASTCVACHGANGKGAFPGVADLAPRMTKTDAQLINSILNGYQSKGSPMAMPAKGGNPKLTAADAAALVTYLRTRLGTPGAAPKPQAAKSPATTVAAQKPQAPKPPAAAVAARKPVAAKSPATVVAAQKPIAAEPPATTVAAEEPMAPTVAAQEPTPAQPPEAADEPAQALAPTSDMAAFARGAKAWGERCASCHAMRDPKDFNDDQWKVITTHMRLRAGLDGADIRDINVFLTGSN